MVGYDIGAGLLQGLQICGGHPLKIFREAKELGGGQGCAQ